MNKKAQLFDLLDQFKLKTEIKEKFNLFVEEIYLYNQKINLSGITNYDQFLDKNIYDSLLILKLKIIEKQKVILDLGTGGGFPGLLLAIIYQEINFILVDSVKKKTDWLIYISEKLALKNVTIINERIENLSKFEEKIDLLLARAVTKLPLLLEISTFLLKKDAYSIFYKGKNYLEELKKINESFLKRRGLKLDHIYQDKLLDNSERYFLLFKRINLNYKKEMISYQKIKKII